MRIVIHIRLLEVCESTTSPLDVIHKAFREQRNHSQ